MKALIIKYLPSGLNSNTKKLYDYIKNVKEVSNVEEIDLLKVRPPIFDNESITSYYLRNYMGKELTDKQKEAIKPFDYNVAKVAEADTLIFVFPMHNFSLPGIVKQFFDSFMFRGEFFEIADEAKKQKIINKKVIVLYTHAGSYPEGTEYEQYDFVKSVLNQEFTFMGMKDIHFISYTSSNPEKKAELLAQAINKIDRIFT